MDVESPSSPSHTAGAAIEVSKSSSSLMINMQMEKNLQQVTKLTEDLCFGNFYETAMPIKAKFYMEPPWERGT